MIYLRADENEAGATVEDWAGGDAWIRAGTSDGVILKDAEARAVVEGLLRRMWERDGWGLTNAWYQRALENWLKSKDIGRQGEGR